MKGEFTPVRNISKEKWMIVSMLLSAMVITLIIVVGIECFLFNKLQKDNILLCSRIDLALSNSSMEIKDSLVKVFALDKKDAVRIAIVLKINADRFHLDWKQLAAKIRVESNFDPFLVSKLTKIGRDRVEERAYGLMQLKPSTAAGAAKSLKVSFGGINWLANENYNVYLGSYIFYEMLGQLDFSFEKAVKAYNCGLQGFKDGLASERHWHKVLYNYKLLNGEKDTLLYKIILAEGK